MGQTSASTTKVAFTTAALDPARTRTMQAHSRPISTIAEFGMLPGTYAQVDIHINEPPSPLVPDEAVVIRAGKTLVCKIDDGHAHYVEVELGYNDGGNVRVLRGLAGGETIGVDVPVEVQEGDPVQAVPLPAPKTPPKAG